MPRGRPLALSRSAGAAGWGLAAWGAVQAASWLLGRRPMALAAVQAALAEWCAGRIGIVWSDALAPMPSTRAIARRAALGAALGGGAAAAAFLLALATGEASRVPTLPAADLLGVGLVASALSAVRDELLLRGVVLRVARGPWPAWAAVAACGAVAAAARIGIDGVVTVSAAADALRGIALGAIWVHDRGAWAAWGANASWTWATGAVTHGGLLDVRFPVDVDAAPATFVVLGAAALAAVVSLRRR